MDIVQPKEVKTPLQDCFCLRLMGSPGAGGICLESNWSRSLVIGSITVFNRSVPKAAEAQSRNMKHEC